MSQPRFHHHTPLLFAGAWSLVTVGAVAQGVVGTGPALAGMAAIGIGQMGAAQALAFSARGHLPWERFWSWWAVTAGVKHLLGSIRRLTPDESAVESVLWFATAMLVTAFVGTVVWWWRQGVLRHPPAISHGLRFAVAVALAVWATSSGLFSTGALGG